LRCWSRSFHRSDNWATMECDPTGSVAVRVAKPEPLMEPVPRVVVPSTKAIKPVGTPADDVDGGAEGFQLAVG